MWHDRILRIIDFGLLPFSITILSKVLGLFVVFRVLNIEWGVADFANSMISVTPVVFARDVTIVSNYSNLVLFVSVLVGALAQFLIALVVNHNHNEGKLVKSALFLSRLNFFSNLENLKIRLFVWIAFLCLVSVYIAVDTLSGRTSWWLAGFSLIITALLTSSAMQFKFKK